MTDEKRRKTEPPLYLDMEFGEALERFVRTDPKEVAELARQAKQAAGPPRSRRPKKTKSESGAT
jgi:hypothetical protein